MHKAVERKENDDKAVEIGSKMFLSLCHSNKPATILLLMHNSSPNFSSGKPNDMSE